MKNLLLITISALSLSFATAQESFKVKNINNKDIYFLSLPTSEYQTVGSVTLNSSDLSDVKTLEDRFLAAFDKYSSLGFDAIITREGKTISFIKYTTTKSNNTGVTANSFGKEIYFLAKPSKKYKVLKTQPVKKETIQHVMLLTDIREWIAQDNESEAIIIENDNISFIKYK